jgi:hypothetical protein
MTYVTCITFFLYQFIYLYEKTNRLEDENDKTWGGGVNRNAKIGGQ